jgi:hypothetical protein
VNSDGAPESSQLIAWAASGRRFWMGAVAALLAAYPIGFIFSAGVGIYLLLRLHVDGAQTDEIADDELDTLPDLPALEPHESGVPEMERRLGSG